MPRDRAETSKRPLPAGFQYDGAVFDASTADAHLAGLLAEVDWEQHEFCIYGRTMPVPRLIAMYGPVAYRYSGIEHAPRPLPSRVAAIRDRIQAATGRRFNAVLLNLYRDGLDGVSWHRDDDYEYGAHGDIASASFGGVRRFQMRDRAGHTAALDLEPGSVLLIDGEALKRWWHRIPKTARPVGPRINLTFRDIAVPS